MDTKPKTLYHGSGKKIDDGFIRVKPAYVTRTNEPITAVFALSDFGRAKLYAVMRLIGNGWKVPRGSDSLYVERVSNAIPEKAYVYELDADGFEYDQNNEYYSVSDKKIKNVIEIDIMQEIKKGNIKIYVLKDKFDLTHMSKEHARAVFRELRQNQDNFELYTPKYYHGSSVDIKDNYLQPRKNFNSVQDNVVSGAFVTSDENYAKFFAINDCISAGHARQEGKKIYLERLQNNIKPEFFVYSVYETPDNPFIHDRGTEYYSTKPIKIAERKKYDTAKEIEKLGYEIYVFDEPLKRKVDKESGNNFSVQAQADEIIKQKKYHRVDIARMIKKQHKSTFQTIVQKLFHQKND